MIRLPIIGYMHGIRSERRLCERSTSVEVLGLNEASATMIDRFGVHDKPGAEEALAAH